LAPTSLARDGMESSGLLETCLAALLMSSVADSVLMNAVDLSTYTWEPPYRFINADVSLPDPDPPEGAESDRTPAPPAPTTTTALW